MHWVDIDKLPELPLSDGMRERLPMFINGGVAEAFAEWNARHTAPLEF